MCFTFVASVTLTNGSDKNSIANSNWALLKIARACVNAYTRHTYSRTCAMIIEGHLNHSRMFINCLLFTLNRPNVSVELFCNSTVAIKYRLYVDGIYYIDWHSIQKETNVYVSYLWDIFWLTRNAMPYFSFFWVTKNLIIEWNWRHYLISKFDHTKWKWLAFASCATPSMGFNRIADSESNQSRTQFRLAPDDRRTETALRQPTIRWSWPIHRAIPQSLEGAWAPRPFYDGPFHHH